MRTGAYLSPHLRLLRRAGRGRRQPGVATSASRRRSAAPPMRPRRSTARSSAGDRVTQFEALTAAAYWELARAGVEVAVVEAGLGGRYDATSVIRSDVQVLTNVSLEHTRWLGPTERHIAEEKLAVVPARRHAGHGPARPRGRATSRSGWPPSAAPRLLMLRATTSTMPRATCGSRPARRRSSARTSRSRWRRRRRYAGSARRRRRCARAAESGDALPGRMEVVADAAAHDPRRRAQPGRRSPRCCAALDALVGERPLVAVLSILDDKDAAGMLAALVPRCHAGASSPRSSNRSALPPAMLESLWRPARRARPARSWPTRPRRSSGRVRAAGPEGAVLVTGSIYLLSDLGARRRRTESRR